MRLAEVMQRDVVWVRPDDTLAEVARVLHDKRVSAAMVLDAKKPVGLITERDFVRAVVTGDDPATTKVCDRMSTDLITMQPGADLDEASALMAKHGIHHLPVVDQGRFVGLVSFPYRLSRSMPVEEQEPGRHDAVLRVFRGPYADGPPARALQVQAPDVTSFGPRELVRGVVIYTVLAIWVLVGLLRRALRRTHCSWLTAASEGMVKGFEQLGPTFVKLGQMIASSPGIFPTEISDVCMSCLDEVPAFSVDEVRRTIQRDLGKPVSQLFRSFDENPLSAASIAQVHACVLPDGREAVVKVQRPNIAKRMNTDLRIMYRLAHCLQRTRLGRTANVEGVILDLHKVTNQELNFALEAHRQMQFRDKIGHFGDNKFITAPEVYWDYCGPHVICMERMTGVPMDHVDTIQAQGVDGELVLRRGMKVWLEALVVHGPFHGDVHAGNLWCLDDGRAAYLDFGIMGEVDEDWRDVFRDLFFTTMIDFDFVRVVRAYKRIGAIPAEADDVKLAKLAEMMFLPILNSPMGSISLGEVFKRSWALVEQSGMESAPQELVLISKQLLYFERYVKLLAPDYVLGHDLFLVKNIFPEVVEEQAEQLGVELPE